MKTLTTFFFFLITAFVFAQPNLNVQTNERAQVNDLENIVRSWSLNNIIELKVEDIEGSAYLNDEFITGTVTLNSGVKYSNIPLRYNVYNNEIEFRSNSGKLFNINNPESIKELTIGDSKFIYTDCKLHNKIEKLFVEVILESDASLLKRHRMKLNPPKEAETHRPAQPYTLSKMPSEFLIKKSDGTVHLFKNKKELISLLSDKSDKINELMKQQKLSAINEKDLLTIVKYYNEN